jgi:hypothetical protein
MATPAPKKARRFGAFAAVMMMGTALVGVLAPSAFAQDDTTSDTTAAESHHRPRLTDEQKACLEEHGVEKPATDENGERVRPTDEQRAAFRAAAEACNIDLPVRHHPRLTEEQRACIQEQGVEKPARGTEPTDEQRAAFRAAAEACGIDLPDAPPSDSSGS